MQVSVETTSELGRRMTVHVPEETIVEKMAPRLKSMVREAKIDGFRPGKAPQSLLLKRFGPRIREDVLSEMIEQSYYDALKAEKLNPASSPKITPSVIAVGEGLSYVADFEVMPEFDLIPFEELELKRLVSEVSEETLDSTVLNLRTQRMVWNETSNPAANGDRVTISFEGKMDGESFTNGVTKDYALVLGSGQFIQGFEENLLGTTQGAKLEFELTFPEDYGNEKLAGKPALFSVEVTLVETGSLPELDEAFLEEFGVEDGSVETFRADIRKALESQMSRQLNEKNKSELMDALLARYSFPIPGAMLEDEMSEQLAYSKKQMAGYGQSFDETAARAHFEPEVKRRVALGLILSRLIRAEQLKLDADRVKQKVFEVAATQEDPDKVVSWFYGNKERMAQIESQVMEDQVLDHVLSKAKVIDENISFQDLMQASRQG